MAFPGAPLAHAGPVAGPSAGMSTMRSAQKPLAVGKRLSMEVTTGNRGRESLRAFAAHSLLGTKDCLLLEGSMRSCNLRAAQMAEVTDFPAFSGAVTRALGGSSSTGALTQMPKEHVWSTTRRSPSEVVASGNVFARALLPPAGLRTEIVEQKKTVNFSAVKYHILADQVTPVRPEEKTAAWSLAHREPDVPLHLSQGSAGPWAWGVPHGRGSTPHRC